MVVAADKATVVALNAVPIAATTVGRLSPRLLASCPLSAVPK